MRQMEDYANRFQFVHRRCGTGLTYDITKTIFLKGIDDDSRDSLNFMGKGDINKLNL